MELWFGMFWKRFFYVIKRTRKATCLILECDVTVEESFSFQHYNSSVSHGKRKITKVRQSIIYKMQCTYQHYMLNRKNQPARIIASADDTHQWKYFSCPYFFIAKLIPLPCWLLQKNLERVCRPISFFYTASSLAVYKIAVYSLFVAFSNFVLLFISLYNSST